MINNIGIYRTINIQDIQNRHDRLMAVSKDKFYPYQAEIDRADLLILLTEANARADAAERGRDELATFLKRIIHLHEKNQLKHPRLLEEAKRYLIDQNFFAPLRDKEQQP